MAQPPLSEDELVASAPEREVLEAFLDLYRGIVVRKATGLPGADAVRVRLPSGTTLAGVVQHLAAVEREWSAVLAGRTAAAAPDDGWRVAPGTSLAAVVDDYRRACEASRATAAPLRLDDAVPHSRLGRVSLRWVLVHLVEETARHTGHLDVLRELTDGATGFDG